MDIHCNNSKKIKKNGHAQGKSSRREIEPYRLCVVERFAAGGVRMLGGPILDGGWGT